MKLRYCAWNEGTDINIAINDSDGEVSGEVIYFEDDEVKDFQLRAYQDSIELLSILMKIGVIEAIATHLQETIFDDSSVVTLGEILEDHGIEAHDIVN